MARLSLEEAAQQGSWRAAEEGPRVLHLYYSINNSDDAEERLLNIGTRTMGRRGLRLVPCSKAACPWC